MYSWPGHSNHAASATAPGPAGGAGTSGPPGSATGVGLGGGAGGAAANAAGGGGGGGGGGGTGAGAAGPGGPGAGPGSGGGPRLESPVSAAQSAASSSFQMPHLRWLPSMMSRSSGGAAGPHPGHAGHAGHTGHTGHPGHPGHTTLPTLSSNLRMGTPTGNPQHLPQQSPVHHAQVQIPVSAQGHPHAHAAHSHPHSHSHSHQHQHQHQHQHSHSHSSQPQPQPLSQGRHTGVAVVVDGRRTQAQQHHPHHHHHQQQQQPQQAESVESSDSEQSDGGQREGRGGSGADGSGDGEYMPSPVENTPSPRAGEGRGRADGRGSSRQGGDGMSAANPVLIGDEIESAAGGGGGSGGGNDASRKHGKRLTTKEEVSLFDICNRHAEEFGQRSNLCNWWRMVTAEFTNEQGHPYSWHSVRRKVELVTKQRMKFLEDQREKGGTEADDMSNPRWRASVDAWIPTWQRWEDAEARRIEKRDSRRPRKRKDRSWESSAGAWEAPNSSDGGGGGGGWRPASSPLVDNHRAFGQNQSSFLPPSSAPSQVRLPPGFDNMFNSASPMTPMGGTGAASKTATSTPDTNMMSAMLETLGKLNKHLDTVNPDTAQNASPLASSFTGSNNPRNHNPRRESQADANANDEDDDPEPAAISASAISKFKEELRQEMRQEIRSELEKDRAAFEDRLDSVQRTQDMILEMLRQEPA